jgi:hypothetical protein
MKHAVSISLGSSKRNKAVEVKLMGETVKIERIGTDGDMEKAAHLYKELDGKVDAFGVGGADLGLMVDDRWYPLHSVQSMVRFIKKTPVVDGTGLKITLENRVVPFIEDRIGEYIRSHGGKKAFVALGGDRWGMTMGLVDGGYECVFGDLMFGLGIGIPIRSVNGLKRLAALAMPIAGRLPFKWVYPTGEKQEIRVPKFEKYYHWATLIAGDRHYIVRHMPEYLPGKVIVTNTTTETDVENFKKAGIGYLVTTTPVIEGRSFGTNMMEAALIAVSGKGRKLTFADYDELLDKLEFEPKIMELN